MPENPVLEVHQYRLPPDPKRAMAFVQQALDSVMGTFKRMQALGTINGVLLKGVTLSATAKSLAHGLGRKPNGWILARQNTNTTVWETAADSTSLTLQAGGACTVNVWVY